jgi:hypothetical protein
MEATGVAESGWFTGDLRSATGKTSRDVLPGGGSD